MGSMERGWGIGFWDPIFVRFLNDWEMDEAVRFLSWLGQKKLCEDFEDMPRWTKTKNGDFMIKAMYKALGMQLGENF